MSFAVMLSSVEGSETFQPSASNAANWVRALTAMRRPTEVGGVRRRRRKPPVGVADVDPCAGRASGAVRVAAANIMDREARRRAAALLTVTSTGHSLAASVTFTAPTQIA
jgi:hypothetical protein